MRDKKGFLALLFNGMLLGTYGIWIRFFQSILSAYQQVIIRGLIALVPAIVIAVILGSKWSFDKKYHKHLVLYLLCFGASTVLFTVGVIQTSIALGVFGLYSGSILSAFVIGALFFAEKLTKKKLLSMLLVFGALMAFTLPFGRNFFNLGLLIAIASGIFDSIGNAFKKYFGGKITMPVLIIFQTSATFLMACLLSFFTHENLSVVHVSLLGTSMLFVYGLVFLAVAYLSMYGFQHFDLNIGTIVISSELFWAPFFAFLIFRETLTIFQILGGLLIAGAILAPYIKTKRHLLLVKKYLST